MSLTILRGRDGRRLQTLRRESVLGVRNSTLYRSTITVKLCLPSHALHRFEARRQHSYRRYPVSPSVVDQRSPKARRDNITVARSAFPWYLGSCSVCRCDVSRRSAR